MERNERSVRLEEIEARMTAIAEELQTADGEKLAALNTETDNLIAERKAINAEIESRAALLSKVAAGGGTVVKETAKDEAEERAKKFVAENRMELGVSETRSAILTTGNLAQPTAVHGINDIPDAKYSGILDLVKVVNCEGMGKNRVAYIATDIDAAGDQTEGSAAGEKEPTFNYVDITPTTEACYSQISKQAKRQTPLNYEAKVREQALIALRKKAASVCVAKLKASSLNATVDAETKTVSGSTTGTITENTLRKLVLNHGGDEGIGAGVLFLKKTDLIAFGDVRGTNEKKAIYKINPDPKNPTRGTIEEGGLVVPYCICSGLSALNGTAQPASSASDLVTMVYGDPQALELDLFSPYEISVSADFAFTSLMDTILGNVDIGADVVVKHGFSALVLKKATA